MKAVRAAGSEEPFSCAVRRSLVDAVGRYRVVPAYFLIGPARAWMGSTDEAFDFFEKQREVQEWGFTSMGNSPLYANLRDDPRWQPFLASVNLDPEFLASVEFNPTLPAEIRMGEHAE